MLMRNSTLTFLELTPKQKIEDRLLFQIAEALEENSSLYHFALDGEFGPSTQPAQDAFERMLEVNFSLESFRLFTCEVQNTPEFQMYLRLNRVGRKLLLNPKGSPTRRDWTDVMGRVSDNLDCLFYLLSVNPFICHVTEELRYQNHQILISRRGNKRRRLNDDTVKQRSETNSSSVNSSLSSSEISSSPAQSAEDCEESSSTDSFEKKGRKKRSASADAHRISNSESSNAKEDQNSSPSNQNSISIETARLISPNHNQIASLLAGLMGTGRNLQESSTSLPGVGAGEGVDLFIAALQALTQNPQEEPQQQVEHQFQLAASAQLSLLQQLQELQIQLQRQQQQTRTQTQLQQQIVNAGKSSQASAVASMAIQFLLSQIMQQQGQQQAPSVQSGTAAPINQLHQLLNNPCLATYLSQTQGNHSYQQQKRQCVQLQQPQTTQNQNSDGRAAAPPSSTFELPMQSSSAANALPLYMPRDKECLSSYQCFLRQQMELFEAGEEDVKSTMPGRNKAIVLGQVGIRCRHCAPLPARYRGTGATYYPAKLDRLYQAAQNMAQTHFTKHCRHIPQNVVNDLAVLLHGSKSSSGAGKKYWSDGARMLGAYEDDEILRLDKSRARAP